VTLCQWLCSTPSQMMTAAWLQDTAALCMTAPLLQCVMGKQASQLSERNILNER